MYIYIYLYIYSIFIHTHKYKHIYSRYIYLERLKQGSSTGGSVVCVQHIQHIQHIQYIGGNRDQVREAVA
jgi:hypothetical protein